MIKAQVIFQCATEVQDPPLWGRPLSYSTGGHVAAAFLMMLLAYQTKGPVQTVVREVSFVEKAAPAPAPVKTVSPAKKILQAIKGPKKTKADGGRKKIRGANIASPRGKKTGKVVAKKPLSGPIVPMKNFGMVGRKKAALVELGGDSRPKPAARDLLMPADSSGPDKMISLDTENMGAIRSRESSIGTPLVSRRVVGASLSGRAKQLAMSAPGRKKRTTAEDLKSNPLDKDKWGKQKGPFSMEGPLKYRKILKMELPPYPRWAEEKGIEASVSIRLWVNPKGKVQDNFYLEKTTGYSELDHLAMEALRKFVFIPLPEGQPQEDEWGVATFRYELKR